MAWGGAEEQAEEIAAGNRHAKNWYDEALQVVEGAMQEYWNDVEAEATAVLRPPVNKPTAQPAGARHAETLESEFDRHRRLLVEQANHTSSSMGWSAELRRYLTELSPNVSKNMDVISWWSVSGFIVNIGP